MQPSAVGTPDGLALQAPYLKVRAHEVLSLYVRQTACWEERPGAAAGVVVPQRRGPPGCYQKRLSPGRAGKGLAGGQSDLLQVP